MTPKSTPARRRTANAIRPRVYLRPDVGIGPGKIDLLRQIEALHSISAAARSMDMSYKRAWQLIDALNQGFGQPVVVTATGGAGGGGARLTALGTTLVAHYDRLERHLNAAAGADLAALRSLLKRPARA